MSKKKPNDAMLSILKKLRLKFILTTTGIVAILIIAVAIGYCINVYSSALNEVNHSLDRGIAGPSFGGSTRQNSQSNPDARSPINEQVPPEKLAPWETNMFRGDDIERLPHLDLESTPEDDDADQLVDLFWGGSALVFSVELDSEGNVIRYNTPGIGLDEEILDKAISEVIASPIFSLESDSTTSGRLASVSLFYEAKIQGKSIYLALTDTASFDNRLSEAISGSVFLGIIALMLTVVVSFFLARLFLQSAEEAWNKQRRFIADASHELKTPLTVIMANTEIIKTEPEAPVSAQMKWLDGIEDESNRMQGLIADLLFLARMDDEQTSKAKPAIEQVNLSEIVENTLVSFEAVAFERHLTLVEDIAEDVYIDAIKSRVVRLPDILVDNACKYADEGGVIKVTLSRVGEKAILRVFNTGPEITKEDLSHLFDRFFRSDESRCDDIPGYGLGLSIAQSIAEESKGTISATNMADETGSGVAFTVVFPASSS